MKINFKSLGIGVILGALIFGIIPSYADLSNIFTAEEVHFPITVDEKDVNIDAPIVVIDGSTYVPLRTLSNILGCQVDWIEDKKQIKISTEKSEEVGDNTVTEINDTHDIVVVNDDIISVDGVEYICQGAFGVEMVQSGASIDSEFIPDENGKMIEHIRLEKDGLVSVVRIYRFEDIKGFNKMGYAYYLLSDYNEKIKPFLGE